MGVLLAGYLTYLLISRWPDIIVGVLIAGLFLKSCIYVLKQARHEMSKPEVPENELIVISLGMPKQKNR